MCWNLGVGVEGETVGTGTAGTRQFGAFTFRTKSRANPPNFLSGPLSKGDALCDRSGHGAGELGFVVE
jgi:hypothetical protein